MNQVAEKPDKSHIFVRRTIKKCLDNPGIAATLRRADNPNTEYQSWDYLASFQIDLDKAYVRLPYATIAAAIAKAEPRQNGRIGIGRAIALSYEDDNQDPPAKAKLRRLLACDSTEEVCSVLRPLFSLTNSRVSTDLDYSRLLSDLLFFNKDA